MAGMLKGAALLVALAGVGVALVLVCLLQMLATAVCALLSLFGLA